MMEMMSSMPQSGMMMTMDMAVLQECLESCDAAMQACTMCADADAGEGMARCASMCMNCADMCAAMMRMMMRPNGYDMTAMMSMLAACRDMGAACAQECEMHADMSDHCRIAGMACRAMAASCDRMMTMMGAMPAMG